MFTNAEKIIYSKLKVDYRNANKEDLVENFTYKNMESELEDENKNVNSTSFIITPYNSMINQYYDDIYYEDLRIGDNIMRFVPKVNELNREYEIKNNEDVDQGFIINKKDQKGKNRIMLSFILMMIIILIIKMIKKKLKIVLKKLIILKILLMK